MGLLTSKGNVVGDVIDRPVTDVQTVIQAPPERRLKLIGSTDTRAMTQEVNSHHLQHTYSSNGCITGVQGIYNSSSFEKKCY